MSRYISTAIAPAYLMLCLILGGASAEGYWVNLILQLLAVPIIAWALLARRKTETPAAARQLLWIAFLTLLVVAIQLIPLPPEMWVNLPGRETVAEGFRLLNLPLPWMPISLTPLNTVASALWLLPALAVLLAVVRLGSFRASWIAWAILIVTGAAVMLGALQILGGERSRWELYEVVNYGSAIGFFANSNHMATLLLVAIPFLAALHTAAAASGGGVQRASGLLVILVGILSVILVGLAINGSLAGLGLAVPVAGASILMIISRKRKLPWWLGTVPALLTIGVVYAVFTGPFGNNLVGQEAQTHGSRQESFRISLEAAFNFFPAGSGTGSFIPVYRTYEDRAAVDAVYMNHAHSDYIELFLETGLLGLLVLALFLIWWGRRAAVIWSASSPDFFARAATIASATIMAHSLVDYPLRTAAISAVFAICCALMAEPRTRASSNRRRSEREKTAVRHLYADEPGGGGR